MLGPAGVRLWAVGGCGCGTMVGKEGERGGVHLFQGPGFHPEWSGSHLCIHCVCPGRRKNTFTQTTTLKAGAEARSQAEGAFLPSFPASSQGR